GDLPPSLAHEVRLLTALLELRDDLPRALERLAEDAPNRERALEAQRWAALSGAAVVPGSCPEGPASLRLTWLRAAVAAYSGTLERLLVGAAEGEGRDPQDLKLATFPDADALGLPLDLHDPLLRAQVVLLRLGRMQDGQLYEDAALLNGHAGRPDVNGVRGPLAAFLQRRLAERTGLDFTVSQAKEASPGCDPWPLRIAEAALAAHAQQRERDPERADATLARARRAAGLALALNPFHRRARLVSAQVALRRCAGALVQPARRRLREDALVAAMLWPQDASAASWARLCAELFEFALPPSATPLDPALEASWRASAGEGDLLGLGPGAAPSFRLAEDLVLTGLAPRKGLNAALEAYPRRIAELLDDETLSPEQRTRWSAVALALDARRVDEVLLAPPLPALAEPAGGLEVVERIARVQRWLTLAAQGQAASDDWVSMARSDLDFVRRRWPVLGVEALSALVELAASPREPATWSDVVLERWPGAVGDALANGRAPSGPLGDALRALAGAAPAR
ncbi:MAG: hypothetical protein KDD82_15090, partial [Planctomycetes bacterium]|nr:hypothetical protein [Planctomycetota bacterium]